MTGSAKQSRARRELDCFVAALIAMTMTSGSSRKSVVGKILAADAVVDVEQSIGIVAALDLEQARVVRAPQSLLPVGLEVVALVDISAAVRRRRAQRIHGSVDVLAMILCRRDVRPGKAVEHRWSAGGDDHQRKGIERIGMSCGVLRSFDRFR